MGILLMRHGQTDWNREGRIQGTLDIGLNKTGRAQVVEACRLLIRGDWRLGRIISSPLRRARESAEICSRALGISMVEWAEFSERCFGELQGMTTNQIRERYGIDDVEEIVSGTSLSLESLDEVRGRVLAGIERLQREFAGEDVLVVTHGSVIKWLMMDYGRDIGIIENAGVVWLDGERVS